MGGPAVTFVEQLSVLSYLCAVLAAVIANCEYFMFYQAWRFQRIKWLGGRFERDQWLLREYRLALDARFAIFSGDLSEECRRHRRRLLWAMAAFFIFLALGTVALYSVHGPN